MPRFESRDSALDRIAGILGGRAAERVVLGDAGNAAGNGPRSDLALATDLAARIRFEWGLAGQLAFTPRRAGESDGAVREIDAVPPDCLDRAERIVEEDRPFVIRIGEILLEERELSAERLASLLGEGPGDLSIDRGAGMPDRPARGRGDRVPSAPAH